MFDDDVCSAADMNKLKRLCVSKQLTRCDECAFAEPNAGHDVPYCTKLTKLGKGEGVSVTDIDKFKPYKLKEGNIPKKCKYWKSATKEQEKKDSTIRVGKIQRTINRLTLEEKKKLKM
jgi:hypothetical protein